MDTALFLEVLQWVLIALSWIQTYDTSKQLDAVYKSMADLAKAMSNFNTSVMRHIK